MCPQPTNDAVLLLSQALHQPSKLGSHSHAAITCVDALLCPSADDYVNMRTTERSCRYGHNELDDPTITLPLSYQAIQHHPTVLQLYASKLQEEAVLKSSEVKALQVRLSLQCILWQLPLPYGQRVLEMTGTAGCCCRPCSFADHNMTSSSPLCCTHQYAGGLTALMVSR